jgi:ADP-heptose:LPS heptosyltransferase
MEILLSRTDRIGDLVLCTPAIATVRASFPQARIRLVTSVYNHVAVARNTDVDEIVDLPSAERPWKFGARFRGADIAIALAPLSIDMKIVGATRAPVRVGYTYVRRYLARATAPLFVNRLMLSEADPELSERFPDRIVRHEVAQLLDLVAMAGATQRVEKLRLDVTDADRAAVPDMPAHPIVLHLGQRWFRSGSTLDSTLELTRRLAELGPVVITVALESDEEARAFDAGRAKVMRNLSFFTWAAVFERARCIVTVDTGATHVASAMRRPTVVAFEHRYFQLNKQEWAPYGVPNRCVRKPAAPGDAALDRFRAEILDAVAALTAS